MKKLLLLLLLLCGIAVQGWAATSNVQAVQGSSASSSAPTRAFGSNVTAGNAIGGFIQWTSTSITLTSVTDSLGNTYTLIHNPTDHIVVRSAMFYAVNIAGGADTLTFNFSSAVTSAQVFHEIGGVSVSPFDGSTINTQDAPGTGTDAVTSTAITTTAAGDYIFGASSEWSTGSAINVGTGFTTAGYGGNASGGNMRGEYLIQGAAGSVAATFTAPGNAYATSGIMAFKAPAAATGGSNNLSLLGVGH